MAQSSRVSGQEERQKMDAADALLRQVKTVPYGVLGSQLGARGIVMRGSDPAKAEGSPIVIVDPAGLHHIQPPGGPCGAGGAAGVIYSWLGIGDDESFPAPVIRSVRMTGDAKLHWYSDQHAVIHAVGPDLRVEDCDAEGAAALLSRAYGNILRQFAQARLDEGAVLRLLPVSGGIFSGTFLPKLPILTFQSLRKALYEVEPAVRTALIAPGVKLELCIFLEDEFAPFVRAQRTVGAGYELRARGAKRKLQQ